jgi:hypothetical protein
MVQGKRKTSVNVSKKLPESDWTVTENTHEAIISREVFADVQKLWDKSAVRKEAYNTKFPKTENIFRGKVFCGRCGFSFFWKRTDKYYGFKCNSRQLYSKDACGGMYITETKLKGIILDMLRKCESFLTQTLPPTADTVPVVDTYREDLAAVRSELDKNNRFLKGLYESLILGDITDSEYKELKKGYETKITTLTAREMQLRENAHVRVQQENVIFKARESVKTITRISDLTAEVICKLVEKIHVFTSGRIGVKFRFTDEITYSGEVSEHE